MRYTDEYRIWVVSEVYKESHFDMMKLKPACEAVAKDLNMSRSVVSLWVNNYLRSQRKCRGRYYLEHGWS